MLYIVTLMKTALIYWKNFFQITWHLIIQASFVNRGNIWKNTSRSTFFLWRFLTSFYIQVRYLLLLNQHKTLKTELRHWYHYIYILQKIRIFPHNVCIHFTFWRWFLILSMLFSLSRKVLDLFLALISLILGQFW